jgi:hypothetical protein
MHQQLVNGEQFIASSGHILQVLPKLSHFKYTKMGARIVLNTVRRPWTAQFKSKHKQGKVIFFIIQMSISSLVLTQPPIRRIMGGSFPKANQTIHLQTAVRLWKKLPYIFTDCRGTTFTSLCTNYEHHCQYVLMLVDCMRRNIYIMVVWTRTENGRK